MPRFSFIYSRVGIVVLGAALTAARLSAFDFASLNPLAGKQLSWPDVALPRVEMPSIDLPKVEMPDINLKPGLAAGTNAFKSVGRSTKRAWVRTRNFLLPWTATSVSTPQPFTGSRGSKAGSRMFGHSRNTDTHERINNYQEVHRFLSRPVPR